MSTPRPDLMDHDPAPIRPKLRPLEVHRVEQDGQHYYLLRDALGLGDGPALIPVALGPLLALCDGVRDVEELAAAFQLRNGVELGRERVAHIIDSLSQGLLLDDERFGAAYGQAVDHFRELPYPSAESCRRRVPRRSRGVGARPSSSTSTTRERGPAARDSRIGAASAWSRPTSTTTEGGKPTQRSGRRPPPPLPRPRSP